MKFQFDPAKAKSNLKKHKVSFADAEGVFYDPLAIHEEIRLISVRHATSREVKEYES